MTDISCDWHGSNQPLASLRPGRDGGIHLGNMAQAQMRSAAFLHRVEFRPRPGAISTSRDTGGNWKSKISAARSKGLDAIRYLNRYEGLGYDAVERIIRDDLDRLPDAKFARVVPGAAHSLIAIHQSDVRVIEIVPGPGGVSLFHACSPDRAEDALANGIPASSQIALHSCAAHLLEQDQGDATVILECRIPAEALKTEADHGTRSWLDIAAEGRPWRARSSIDVPAFRIAVHKRIEEAIQFSP